MSSVVTVTDSSSAVTVTVAQSPVTVGDPYSVNLLALAALTMAAGSIIYPTGSATLTQLAHPAATGQILTSGAASTLAWSGANLTWAANSLNVVGHISAGGSGSGGISRSDAQIEIISPSGGGHALLAIFQNESPAMNGPFEEAAVTYNLRNSAGTIVQGCSLSTMWCTSSSNVSGFAMARMNVTANGGTAGDISQRWYGAQGIALFAPDDTSAYAPGPSVIRNYGSEKVDGGVISGGLIRSQGSTTPAYVTGPGIEFGYSTGGAQSFVQSYNRTSSAFGPLNIAGSLINFTSMTSFVINASAAAGSELVRIAGGSAPGTPGSTDVLFGGGQIRVGGLVTIAGTLDVASAVTVTVAGAVITGVGVSGSPNYILLNNTANSGGKSWRIGDTGALGYGNFSIYDLTDNVLGFGVTPTGSVLCGQSVALATNATDGFLYVPTCAGTPTGTPTTQTGRAAIVVNTTNNKLYFYSGGAWRDAGP